MDPAEIRECFDYLIDSRERFLDSCRRVGWQEFGSDRGASWGSMLLIFLHRLDVEEGWLQFAARGRSITEAPDRRPTDYTSFEDIARDGLSVAGATRTFLENLTAGDLRREVEIPHGPGRDVRTVEKILMHAFVDEVAHLGELVSLLWQLKVEPPYLDWLDYHEVHSPECRSPGGTRPP